ncbi:Fungal specific transcription factor domain-containing protein 57 [Elsinoe fawcettii]|nr:Fungal specific transcription factor domain-containing protein 57 [Elsinoe fawcettii]
MSDNADYDTDEDLEEGRVRKKRRKQRPLYSCHECRRLKMKCDRQVPCSNCVRRNRTDICRRSRDNDRSSDAHAHGRAQPIDVNETAHTSSRPSYGGQARDTSDVLVYHEHHGHEAAAATVPTTQHGQAGTSSLQTRSAPFLFGANLHTRSNRHPTQSSTTVQSNRESSLSIAAQDGVRGGRMNAAPNSADTAGDGAPDGSYGTLVLSEGGRSKYLGPTAGSEWLRDSATQIDAESTPLSLTRPSSPARATGLTATPQNYAAGDALYSGFPFGISSSWASTRDLLERLPPKDEAISLIDSYYRYCAWHHDVAPRPRFERTLATVYSHLSELSSSRVNPQDLALVFIVMAQGTVYNIEMAYDASAAEYWLRLAEIALARGDFLSNNTVAGLQTLHLMAHLHLNWDKGSRGDKAWPLWGLVMRLMQAMGMHRDGARWNLPDDIVEERRKVFWECHAADIFQAHCFSRPCAINPEHCDTRFPSDTSNSTGGKGYYTLRFELSQLSSEILNMAMKVRKPAYSEVLELDARLNEFERCVPFNLRSRTAYLSMPSRYPLHEDAIQASPEPSRTSRMNLAFNTSETIINLHRPYYAKALYAAGQDPVKSDYAPSFLTVVERCAVIIALVADVQSRFPNVSTRQWNLWYHVFGSAICLGTLLLKDPGNAISSFVLAQIDSAVALFNSLIEHGGGTSRYRANLAWLTKLRDRAMTKMQAAASGQRSDTHTGASANQTDETQQENEDIELVGWRTRLIERAGHDHPSVKTIRNPAVPSGHHTAQTNSSTIRNQHPQYVPAANQHPAAAGAMNNMTPNSTDDLLHDFWDPMFLQDIFEMPMDNHEALPTNGAAWWSELMGERS